MLTCRRETLAATYALFVISFLCRESLASESTHHHVVVEPETGEVHDLLLDDSYSPSQESTNITGPSEEVPVPMPSIIGRTSPSPTAISKGDQHSEEEDSEENSQDSDDEIVEEEDSEDDEDEIHLEHDWWKNNFTFHEMWMLLDCDDLNADEDDRFDIWSKPASWIQLRQTYIDSILPASEGANSDLTTSIVDGFAEYFPVSVKISSPERELGVFAESDIPKGARIHSRQVASFQDSSLYRKLIGALPSFAMSCDVLRWTNVMTPANARTVEQKESLATIEVALDPVVFLNVAAGVSELNIGCPPEWNDRDTGGCKENMYALRDISRGEELLVKDYGSVFHDGWTLFGL